MKFRLKLKIYFFEKNIGFYGKCVYKNRSILIFSKVVITNKKSYFQPFEIKKDCILRSIIVHTWDTCIIFATVFCALLQQRNITLICRNENKLYGNISSYSFSLNLII